MDPLQSQFQIQQSDALHAICGPNGILSQLEEHSGAKLSHRGDLVLLRGTDEAVDLAFRFLENATALIARGHEVLAEDVAPSLRLLKADPSAQLTELLDATIRLKKRTIAPKTAVQRRYIKQIRANSLCFGVGPAGTGKTYLAMAAAVQALNDRKVKKIILTRPAVEAGEKLGFLPGDLAEKVNPYLQPLYDALHDMMDFDKVSIMRERGIIEVAPLAFMRGRTLSDAFVILDEAQNATMDQMRMFLTRLGYGSRAVVTGDVTQTDLPRRNQSGLAQALQILRGVEGIAFTQFSDVDVVRHPLVQRIIVAYEAADRAREERHAERRAVQRFPSSSED